MRSRFVSLGLMLSVGLGFAGCGESEPEETQTVFPVSGVVTLDGKPLTNASVQLHPQAGGDATQVYYGTTDMEGKYDLISPRGTPGCEVGTYTVTISKFAQKDGSPLPADAGAAEFAALGVEHMPPKYNDPVVSELRAVIPQG